MVKIYAVIDTNVLVSALLSRFKDTSTAFGAPGKVRKEVICKQQAPSQKTGCLLCHSKSGRFAPTLSRRAREEARKTR